MIYSNSFAIEIDFHQTFSKQLEWKKKLIPFCTVKTNELYYLRIMIFWFNFFDLLLQIFLIIYFNFFCDVII